MVLQNSRILSFEEAPHIYCRRRQASSLMTGRVEGSLTSTDTVSNCQIKSGWYGVLWSTGSVLYIFRCWWMLTSSRNIRVCSVSGDEDLFGQTLRRCWLVLEERNSVRYTYNLLLTAQVKMLVMLEIGDLSRRKTSSTNYMCYKQVIHEFYWIIITASGAQCCCKEI